MPLGARHGDGRWRCVHIGCRGHDRDRGGPSAASIARIAVALERSGRERADRVLVAARASDGRGRGRAPCRRRRAGRVSPRPAPNGDRQRRGAPVPRLRHARTRGVPPTATTAFLVEQEPRLSASAPRPSGDGRLRAVRRRGSASSTGVRACRRANRSPSAAGLDRRTIALSALGEGRISIAAGLGRRALDGDVDPGPREQVERLDQRPRRAPGAHGWPLADQHGLRFRCSPRWPATSSGRRAVTQRGGGREDPWRAIVGEVSRSRSGPLPTAAMKVATDAVQLFGATGYSRETASSGSCATRRVAQIYEGTNQIHRMAGRWPILSAMLVAADSRARRGVHSAA